MSPTHTDATPYPLPPPSSQLLVSFNEPVARDDETVRNVNAGVRPPIEPGKSSNPDGIHSTEVTKSVSDHRLKFVSFFK